MTNIKTFKIEFIRPEKLEFCKIGFDKTHIDKGLEKHQFVSLKVFNLNCAQANILKQTAISTGTDCAVHRETITGRVEQSDCILSGSLSQFKKIAHKLKFQPFKLSKLGDEISALLFEPLKPMTIRNSIFSWTENTYIMGIVNVTPDSFSDGGEYFETEKAVKLAFKLVSEGADIIDIGGESTRPYSEPVNSCDEISRVIPVIKGIRKINQTIPISIDTRNSQTAKAALEAGADLINDVSACDWDDLMPEILKKYDCPIILNHAKGTPENMQDNTDYPDVVQDVFIYFEKKLIDLEERGVDLSKVILDVGIGFGKDKEQNYKLLKNISAFKSLGCPLLVGHSRKKFLQKTFDTANNETLDIATNAVSSFLINEKVNILRVHDVRGLQVLRTISKELRY